MKKLFYFPLMIALSFISCKKESPQSYEPQDQRNNNLTGKKTSIGSTNGREGSEITLNLILFLQGYYIGERKMQPVLQIQGVKSAPDIEADSILVELVNPETGEIVEIRQAVLHTDGTVSVGFDAPSDNYYIVIKHRNSIETWSANPVKCTLDTEYDFSKSDTQAYKDNQVQVEDGVWALYTGDITQDGKIDEEDFKLFDEDSNNGVNSVYVATDLNGDGFVDGNDFPVLDINMYQKIHSLNPFN
jgi:hypothetical protein